MDEKALTKQILDCPLGKGLTIYKIDENTEIYIHKPEMVPTKLKQSERYDPKKNFQIGIRKKGFKEFLPNHLRIMIDLHLKKKDDPQKCNILFDAIEKVYDGTDPESLKDEVSSLDLKQGLEKPYTILCLSQLFFLEQDINYDFGKVQPPRAYLMGYIRMIRLDIEEIDKLLWNSTRHPPRTEFRSKECLESNNS